jgi:hypothetical protein
LLLNSGFMQLTRPRRSAAALVVLTASLALWLAPGRASADSPKAIQGTATAAVAVVHQIGTRFVTTHAAMPPVSAPASAAFISSELVDKLSRVINNGIRLGQGPGDGTFYVHFKSHGFGGVLSIRYRR